MDFKKPLIFLSLLSVLLSCNDISSEDFKLMTNAQNSSIQNNETLQLSVLNNKNHSIDSIVYFIDEVKTGESTDLAPLKLGKTNVKALVYMEGFTHSLGTQITILSSTTPKIYSFNILNEYPHDITSYTQGLEFHNGQLYESTGEYGESKLRKVAFKTGDVLQNVNLAQQYFGEGLTIINNQIHQLTWREGVGFTYNLETLEKEGSFTYNNSKEGWGLCNDGSTIYKSDGTEKIWSLDPNTLAEKDFIQAYHNKGKVIGLNELEWINGKIYANRYQLNGVAIINPKNGAVEGVIDFTPLRKLVTQHPKLDVLNGLAYNPETQTLFVTGKYWDKLFEVEIVEK